MKVITNTVLLLMLLTSINSFAKYAGKPCINGHENVAPDTILIYTLLQDFPSFSLVNQGAAASIHDYYNDTILVNTGPSTINQCSLLQYSRVC